MEEDFKEMLEQYLDYSIIEEKKILDEEEADSLNNSKSESPFDKEEAISIDKFVNDYLGYEMNCSTLYHSGLRELGLEYVVGISNDFANDNVEYVKRGFILLVIDARGKRGTYLNPEYVKKYFEKDDIVEEYKIFSRLQEIELSKLNAFYTKYMLAKAKFDDINTFLDVLRESRSVRKLERIKKERRNKND